MLMLKDRDYLPAVPGRFGLRKIYEVVSVSKKINPWL